MKRSWRKNLKKRVEVEKTNISWGRWEDAESIKYKCRKETVREEFSETWIWLLKFFKVSKNWKIKFLKISQNVKREVEEAKEIERERRYIGAIQLIGFPERGKRGHVRTEIISGVTRRQFPKAEQGYTRSRWKVFFKVQKKTFFFF